PILIVPDVASRQTPTTKSASDDDERFQPTRPAKTQRRAGCRCRQIAPVDLDLDDPSSATIHQLGQKWVLREQWRWLPRCQMSEVAKFAGVGIGSSGTKEVVEHICLSRGARDKGGQDVLDRRTVAKLAGCRLVKPSDKVPEVGVVAWLPGRGVKRSNLP